MIDIPEIKKICLSANLFFKPTLLINTAVTTKGHWLHGNDFKTGPIIALQR